ncbi:hypothetical protein AB0O57_27815 [Streptomyces sp. NPDC091201]|uniref:hypothetical protein n=1 Tax=Streptomyces sp. NPDC091201 TaxID=3155190 RepID=UPI00343B869F
MGLSDILTGPRNLARTGVRRIKQTPAGTRRALTRADHWVQDHIILAAACAIIAVFAVTGTTWWYWGEALLALAKTYQPLLTIVWIVISAIALIVRFFATRRAARVALAASATAVPPTTDTAAPATATTPGPATAVAPDATAGLTPGPAAGTTATGGSRVH